jgi:hypothetical protein
MPGSRPACSPARPALAARTIDGVTREVVRLLEGMGLRIVDVCFTQDGIELTVVIPELH